MGRAGLERCCLKKISELNIQNSGCEPGTLPQITVRQSPAPQQHQSLASRTDRSEKKHQSGRPTCWEENPWLEEQTEKRGGRLAPQFGPLGADGEKCPKVFEVQFSRMKIFLGGLFIIRFLLSADPALRSTRKCRREVKQAHVRKKLINLYRRLKHLISLVTASTHSSPCLSDHLQPAA